MNTYEPNNGAILTGSDQIEFEALFLESWKELLQRNDGLPRKASNVLNDTLHFQGNLTRLGKPVKKVGNFFFKQYPYTLKNKKGGRIRDNADELPR